ncbi:MAG: AAA family ATPase [Congregibacter sp.]
MSEENAKAEAWLGRLFREGWRRKALQTAAAYAVAAWVTVEVASVVLDAFAAPSYVLQLIIILALTGFPIAMVLSWLFDVTPHGLVRTADSSDIATVSIEDANPDETNTDTAADTLNPAVQTRRHLTILCASIELADPDSTDPEDLVELQLQLELLFNKVCIRFGGHVLPAGTGVLHAWFGYPSASEDAARNAVRTALGLIDGLERYANASTTYKGTETPFRVAVHSGDVIVHENQTEAEGTPQITGMAPRQAVKLLESGVPGEALISAEVFRSVRGFFELEAIDSDAPASGYRVLYESLARSRLEALERKDLLPMVGRDLELRQLNEYWNRAANKQGQVVLLTGSGGIGKSRLSHELKLQVAKNTRSWMIEYRCESIHAESALYPVIVFYRRLIIGVLEEGSASDHLARIEGFLAEYNQDLNEAVPIFADLLGVAFEDRYEKTGYSPQKQRAKALDLLVDLMTQRAARQPVLLIMENLHWADPSSIELMGMLIEQAPALSMMCLLTVRTPFELPWAMSSHVAQINLTGLDTQAVASVCQSISASLPAPVVESIAEKADGVPLFVEEVTRSLVDTGAFDQDMSEQQLKELIENIIPSTLKDVLTARLDSLGGALDIAQLGATIGRDFSHKLITEVATRVESPEVEARLEALVAPEIVHRLGAGNNRSYRFKHALVQDAAYQLMLKRKRQDFHTAICDVLVQKFPDLVDPNPEILAFHYEGAEDYQQAIHHLTKVADKAMLTAATAEAISALLRGLRLVEKLPTGEQRTLLELQLQTALGSASMFAYGYASERAHNAYMRAEGLLREDIPLQYVVPVVMGLSAYHSVRGATQEGQRHNNRILEIANQTGDEDLALWANGFLCVGDFYEGHFSESREHLDVVQRLYDFDRHRNLSVQTSQDPKVFAMAHCNQSLWAMGAVDQAAEMAKQQEDLAVAIGHPLVLQQALGWGNVVFLYRGEAERLIEKAQHAHEMAVKQGLTFYIGGNKVWWGAALVQKNKFAEGLEKMREGISLLGATGAEIGKPMMLALVADALGKSGEPEQGLQELDAALAQIERWGERFYLAECYRLQGEMFARLDRVERAWECFEQSLATARQQGARSFELRTEISRTQLALTSGDASSELAALRSVYDGIEEGRSTADQLCAADLMGRSAL